MLIVTDCELDVSVSSDEDDEELPSFLAQESIRPSVNAKKAAMKRRVSFFIVPQSVVGGYRKLINERKKI